MLLLLPYQTLNIDWPQIYIQKIDEYMVAKLQNTNLIKNMGFNNTLGEQVQLGHLHC